MLRRKESNCDADYQYFKCAKPLDFSRRKLESLEALNGNEQPIVMMAHGAPKKNHYSNRYKTGSFWLSNNKLEHVNGLRSLTDRLLEMPDYLSWLNLSCNRLTSVSNEFLLFPNLTMLYLHRNYIADIVEVYKLRGLKKLRVLTLNKNPLCNDDNYRKIVLHMLPCLQKLDNVVVVRSERELSKKLSLGNNVRLRLLNAYPEDFVGIDEGRKKAK